MGTAAAIVGGSVVSGLFTSRSQKKAAEKQAEGISNAQAISQAAANRARQDALSLFDPAFNDITAGIQGARDDLLAGRQSSTDILNQAFSQAANTYQTSGQQALNAILGVSPQQPQVAQPREGFRFPPVGERQKSTGRSDLRTAAPVERGLQTAVQPQVIPPTDGGMANVQGLRGGPQRFNPPGEIGFERPLPREATTNTIPGGPADGPVQPNREAPITPLEGELLPLDMATANYNLQAPQGEYGLAGAESALRQGLAGQTGALTQGAYDALGSVDAGFDQARGDIATGVEGGLGLLGQGVDQGRTDIASGLRGGLQDLYAGAGQARGDLTGQLGAGLNALYSGAGQARGDITGQLDAGLGALRSGIATGRGDISSARDEAIGYLNPYSDVGNQALQREAALTGALGPEAQQAAFDAYNESPGQKFFRDQQERALLRNAAATGQTQSGNVLTALQEQAQGIASQNYQQDLSNLRSLAGRGQQAATTQGGFQQQAGSQLANLAFQGGAAELGARQAAGANLANIAQQTGLADLGARQNVGSQLANIAQGTGQASLGAQQGAAGNLANLAFGGAQAGSGLLERGTGALSQLAANRGLTQAGIQQGLGKNLSNVYGQTGANIAGLRSQAGRDIAQQLGLSGQQLAQLQSGLGQNLANIDQQTAANLANLSAQYGQSTSGLRTGLAALLANLATGAGSQQANLATQLGGAQAAGVTNPVGNTISQLLGLYASNPGAFGG